MQEDVEKVRKDAEGVPDIDCVNHYRDLDRYNLRSTEWKTGPLENPDHDFVSGLIKDYLADIDDRQHKNMKNRPFLRACLKYAYLWSFVPQAREILTFLT